MAGHGKSLPTCNALAPLGRNVSRKRAVRTPQRGVPTTDWRTQRLVVQNPALTRDVVPAAGRGLTPGPDGDEQADQHQKQTKL
jgi:hypothetical protein